MEMAVEGTCLGENILVQPPPLKIDLDRRVEETHVQSGTCPLLAFADMVLSFDQKAEVDNFSRPQLMKVDADVLKCVSDRETRSKSRDHTYATSNLSRSTRSRTAKNAQQSSAFQDITGIFDQDLKPNFGSTDIPCSKTLKKQTQSFQQGCSCNEKVKDKSMVSTENKYHDPKEDFHGELTKQNNLLKRNNEDVSVETCKQENVKKYSSQPPATPTLLTNNVIEYPTWHRKADHTYATATWGGTAASRNIFDRHHLPSENISDTDTQNNGPQDHCMEVQEDEENQSPPNLFYNPQTWTVSKGSGLVLQQKDDHTYVKPTQSELLNKSSDCDSNLLKSKTPIKTLFNSTSKLHFSSATFPRLKSREDHTYFHSGLSGTSSSVGREWSSVQTVASSDVSVSQEMQIEETYRSLHSFAQSASAKKDHNYSSST